MNKILKPWYEVVDSTTIEGKEEHDLFISLSRDKKTTWKTAKQISLDTNISQTRVEEIIYKYFKMGLIFQDIEDDDCWGYWENHLNMVKKNTASLREIDEIYRSNGKKDPRIKDYFN